MNYAECKGTRNATYEALEFNDNWIRPWAVRATNGHSTTSNPDKMLMKGQPAQVCYFSFYVIKCWAELSTALPEFTYLEQKFPTANPEHAQSLWSLRSVRQAQHGDKMEGPWG